MYEGLCTSHSRKKNVYFLSWTTIIKTQHIKVWLSTFSVEPNTSQTNVMAIIYFDEIENVFDHIKMHGSGSMLTKTIIIEIQSY